jgi:hypothetical protein
MGVLGGTPSTLRGPAKRRIAEEAKTRRDGERIVRIGEFFFQSRLVPDRTRIRVLQTEAEAGKERSL